MQETLRELDELVKKELKGDVKKVVAAGKLSPENTKEINNTVCLMKDLYEVMGIMGMGNSYGYDHMVDGYSNMRGRSATTGRFVSRDMDPMMRTNSYDDRRSYGGMSYGYSGHSDEDRVIDTLERMYDTEQSPHMREVIDKCIQKLQIR